MPLDTLQFNSSKDSLILFDLVKDTIAYQGSQSPPDNVHYYIYWRAFKVLNEKELLFLKTQEIKMLKFSAAFGRNFHMPVTFYTELKQLFYN
jgi:hypothetical protein